MANAGPNTNGSQFFIVSGPSGVRLPPQYSLFGKVVKGLEVLAEMESVDTDRQRQAPHRRGDPVGDRSPSRTEAPQPGRAERPTTADADLSRAGPRGRPHAADVDLDPADA